MKRLITIACIAALFAFTPDHSATVNFTEASFKSSLMQAKSENKIMMVFVYSAHCHLCHKMLAETFNDPKVAKMYNTNFTCVKMNSDELENHYRSTNWGVSAVPSFVFFGPDRKILYVSSGYKDPSKLINMAEISLRKVQKLKTALQAIAQAQ